MNDDTLPCPQCGHTLTLSKLRRKRADVKKRLEASKRKRYTNQHHDMSGHYHTLNFQPKSGGTKISPNQIHGMGTSYLSVAPTDPTFSGDLVIASPSLYDKEAEATVMINDALLDVCLNCGAFYASNAAQLREQLETEIAEMDPLGALAEIRNTEGLTEG